MNVSIRTKNMLRAVKILSLTFAGLLLLLLVSVAFVPMLISSHAVQGRIQQTLTTSLHRPVSWSKLAVTWSDGISLTGLALGDGPAPLLKTNIDQIGIKPSISRGTDGRFGVDLTVQIRNVRAELAPGPPIPPPPPGKDPLTQLAEAIQHIQGLDFALPVDVCLLVDVAPVQVVYRVPGKQLQLHDFSVQFAMPSLVAKPITAAVKGGVTVDGRALGNVSCSAEISGLVTKTQRIHLASALFAVDAALPGSSITLSGGLSHADGFVARWKLDLPGLLSVATPFLPPALPKLTGKFDILLRAKADSNNDLHATMTIDGSGLTAQGGSLKSRHVGPLVLKLQQQIATDHTAQRVDFLNGSLALPGVVAAEWHASVLRPTVPERSLDVAFGPLRVNLPGLLATAAPFLPPGISSTDIDGEAFLHSLTLHLAGPKNQGTLALAGLGASLPRLHLALKSGVLNASDCRLLLEKMECPLSANVPTRLTADLLWSVKNAALSGAQPLEVRGARGKTALVVSDLNLKSRSPRKVSASATVANSFDLDHVSVGSRMVVDAIHEQLRLEARAAENGDINANLPECVVTAASLKGTQGGKHFGPVPLSAAVTAAALHIFADTRVRPTLQLATATLSAGDILHVSARGTLAGASPQRITTSGSAQLDLKRALLFAAPFAPSGVKGDGKAAVTWDLAAPLPDKAPAFDKNPVRSAKSGLALIDTCEFRVKLDNISATVPSGSGAITVSGLATGPDVRIYSTGNGQAAGIEGTVRIAGVSGLAGAAGTLPVQHGSFAFNGRFSGGSEFRLSEQLRVDPLGISHEAELNVSRIDALGDEQQPFSTAALIKRLNATLIASVDGKFSRELQQLLPGIAVAGAVGGSIRADLGAGHDLSLRCGVTTRDFGVRLADGTTVEGLRSDIAINRVYVLATPKGGSSWTPLSASLVRPSAVSTANPGAAEIAGRINTDLRGDLGGVRSFSVKRIVVKASGVPLELTELEGDLLFTREKAGISFLQADLLGGTLLARGLFDLLPEIPVLATAGSFSNLDVAYLLPKDAAKRRVNQDSEITGEMSFSAPLTPEQRELFEQLRLSLNIRKIGADTLERALFSLDPYERNEQVVAQRKMLRLGGLKGLRAQAVDGAFGLEGEAYVKGIEVELPKVERLRISELPLRQELQKSRASIMSLRGLLELVRADTLVVGANGGLTLKRRTHEK